MDLNVKQNTIRPFYLSFFREYMVFILIRILWHKTKKIFNTNNTVQFNREKLQDPPPQKTALKVGWHWGTERQSSLKHNREQMLYLKKATLTALMNIIKQVGFSTQPITHEMNERLSKVALKTTQTGKNRK